MKYLNEAEFSEANVFGKGQENTRFAQFFIGESFLNPLTEFGKSPLFLANVTFDVFVNQKVDHYANRNVAHLGKNKKMLSYFLNS